MEKYEYHVCEFPYEVGNMSTSDYYLTMALNKKAREGWKIISFQIVNKIVVCVFEREAIY